jgi:hypothetical protein
VATGDSAGARQRLQTAVDIFTALPAGAQQDTYPLYTHAANLYHLGQALQAQGDKPAAKQRYEQSLAVLDDMEKRFGNAPGNISAQDARTALERLASAR